MNTTIQWRDNLKNRAPDGKEILLIHEEKGTILQGKVNQSDMDMAAYDTAIIGGKRSEQCWMYEFRYWAPAEMNELENKGIG